MKKTITLEVEEVSENLYLHETLGEFEQGSVKGSLSALVPSGSLRVRIREPVQACYLLNSADVVEAVIKAVLPSKEAKS